MEDITLYKDPESEIISVSESEDDKNNSFISLQTKSNTQMQYTFKCIRTLEDIGNFKDTLLQMAKNRDEPNMVQHNIEYLKFQVSQGASNSRPLLCVLYENDFPVIITLGEIETVEMSPSITYFKLRMIKFRKICYHIYPFAVFGKYDSPGYSKLFINMFFENLRKENIDYIFFNLLRGKTAFSSDLLNIKNPLIREVVPNYEKHFILKVPESLESFLATKDSKNRYTLKKVIKKLESEYKGKHSVRVFEKEEEVEKCFEDIEIIAKKSQLRAINVGFKPTEDELKEKKWLAKNGYFRTYILYLNDLPVSYMSGTNYERHFLIEFLGFDLTYEKMRVGRYLQLKLIEDIAQAKCADFIDFGFGGDSYKKEMSTTREDEIRLKTYLPKSSNIVFIITISLSSIINRWTRKLLKKTQLYEKVRKLIRLMSLKKVRS